MVVLCANADYAAHAELKRVRKSSTIPMTIWIDSVPYFKVVLNSHPQKEMKNRPSVHVILRYDVEDSSPLVLSINKQQH